MRGFAWKGRLSTAALHKTLSTSTVGATHQVTKLVDVQTDCPIAVLACGALFGGGGAEGRETDQGSLPTTSRQWAIRWWWCYFIPNPRRRHLGMGKGKKEDEVRKPKGRATDTTRAIYEAGDTGRAMERHCSRLWKSRSRTLGWRPGQATTRRLPRGCHGGCREDR